MRATWRGLTACRLMIAAVLAFRFNPPVQGEGAIVDAVLLACSVGTGVLVYVGTTLLLWWTCGRPQDSAEAHVLTIVRAAPRHRRMPSRSPAAGQGALHAGAPAADISLCLERAAHA